MYTCIYKISTTLMSTNNWISLTYVSSNKAKILQQKRVFHSIAHQYSFHVQGQYSFYKETKACCPYIDGI